MLNAIATKSFLVRDGLDLQEFFQTPLTIEATLDILSACMFCVGKDVIRSYPSALLNTTVWKHCLVAAKC